MEIVIKIPKEYYDDYIVDAIEYFLSDYCFGTVCKITPLPKGHGRLGDLDALEKEIEDYSEGTFAMTPEFLVKHAPTIIEVDKEE